MDIVDKINQYLLETEQLANEYLPLKDTLEPIQTDLKSALSELKQKAEGAQDLEDKVFYINRYTDLVKKVESIFDSRSKRLQQSISMLSKLPDKPLPNDSNNQEEKENEENEIITPEQANAILKILNSK